MYGKLNTVEWPIVGPWAELRALVEAIERVATLMPSQRYRVLVEKSVLITSNEPVYRITLLRFADPRMPNFGGEAKTVLGVYTDVYEAVPILKLLYSNLDEELQTLWEGVSLPAPIPHPPYPKPPKPNKPRKRKP